MNDKMLRKIEVSAVSAAKEKGYDVDTVVFHMEKTDGDTFLFGEMSGVKESVIVYFLAIIYKDVFAIKLMREVSEKFFG